MKNMNKLFKGIEEQSGIIKHISEMEPLDTRDYHDADYQYESILKSIKSFESELDDNLEVAVHLAAFGQSIVMQVSGISYSNPSLIHFYGYVNGGKSQLIQHVSQLNFLLMAVPKIDPKQPARRIGFSVNHDAAVE